MFNRSKQSADREKSRTRASWRRSYESDLRVVGRRADEAEHENLGIYEVNDGFLVRGFPAGLDTLETFEIPDSDLGNASHSSMRHRGKRDVARSNSPLHPTGYERLLRVVGYELDERQACSVAIQEMVESWAVIYRRLHETKDDYAWEAHEWLVDQAKVAALLGVATDRRGSQQAIAS